MLNTSPPILEQGTLDTLRDILGDELELLLRDMLHETPDQLGGLRQAAEACDTEALSRIAHIIKGSSGNLGLVALSQSCQILEDQARDGAVDEPLRLVERIEFEFRRSAETLKQTFPGVTQ